MAKKKKKIKIQSDEGGFVFSTNPDFVPEPMEENSEDSNTKFILYIWLEKQGRGGKTVSIVRGFEGNELELKLLGSKLKSAMSTGGSVKEGEIILQGDVRDKLAQWFDKEGMKWKKAGG